MALDINMLRHLELITSVTGKGAGNVLIAQVQFYKNNDHNISVA